ncbi:MAG TPA: hypothetical protein PLF22_11590 [Pseudomonadales bacterium]|nr:hypothetical protein [Pseudomonadales bacterium]
MIPLLIGGLLIYLVGSVMLLVAAFSVSVVWGLLCLLLPPVQLLFLVMHWNKVWDALLMQVFGIAMVFFFFTQIGGFDQVAIQQEWVKFQRQHGMVVTTQSSTTTVLESQGVKTVTVPPVSGTSGGVQAVGDSGGVVSVTAAASKEVDDKPIYKCTDKDGNETYSRKACAGRDK